MVDMDILKYFKRKDPEGHLALKALFDADWYRLRYADIAEAGVDPLTHYMETGWKEDRQPFPLFDPAWYIRQFPELADQAIPPLPHYLSIGAKEGASPSPLFDARAYIRRHPDACEPGTNVLLHFLAAPVDRDFNPCPLFNTSWYLDAHPVIASGPENYLLHFARAGAFEGLNPSPDFDCGWYLDQNPDVADSGVNPLAHYIAAGADEGRRPCPPSPMDWLNLHAAGLPDDPDEPENWIGAYERYGEYSATHTGPAVVLPDSPPETLPKWEGRLAVHVHVFYDDLASTIEYYLRSIHVPFCLFVSAPDLDIAIRMKKQLGALPFVESVTATATPNRGRDLAPMLTVFAEALLDFDLVLHLHSKKSSHSPNKRDWATQLFHHLLHSREHFDQVLSLFAKDPSLGLVFPVYHASVGGQIVWGSNRRSAKTLFDRLGIDHTAMRLQPFPAGSFFLVRPIALRGLLKAGIAPSDFETSNGSVDGQFAHTVERAIPIIVEDAGFHSLQIRSEKPHALSTSWTGAQTYHSPRHADWTDVAQIAPFACRVHNAAGLNIAVYTCATGGYDVPLPHESLIESASYHFFSEQQTGWAGFWRLAPLAFPLTDPVRCARIHKTSPQRLLLDADIAVWIDGNIAVTGDIARYVDQVVAANASFGLVAHPIRSTYLEEAEAIVRYGLDTADIVAKQVGRYVIEGFLGDDGLTETNFMIMDLRRPETRSTLDIWRSEIEQGSRRDQLSFDYARWKAGATSEWLFEAGGSVRSNPAFAYVSHGGTNHADLEFLQRMTLPPTFSDLAHDRSLSDARDRARKRSVDIVVCVHNAPDDVANCLTALDRTRDSLTRLILVDDGSDQATASIVAAHADANRNDIVIRHDTARGYTRAANAGLRASTGDYAVLLNSDAVVSQGAIRAMIAAAERDVSSGLAGPLSNAASWQSVPDQVDATGDYAINDLPTGLTHEDIARRCADLAADPHIFVPALNGFCMAISRKCLQKTGTLDETAFPNGYGEETDYCLRAADLGFQCVVATDAYVFHAKSRSFGPNRRRIHSTEGYQRLVARYGKTRLEQVIDAMRNARRLQAIRTAFARRT